MIRKLTAAALVFLACVALAFALGELAVRSIRQPPRRAFDRPTRLVAPSPQNRVRHLEPIPPKDPGTYRIFVLGDSFTWGTNVMADAAYPHHLEWVLRRTASRPFEVFNYGVAGSCTADQIALLEAIAKHDPDMVVIGYFLNDPDPGRHTPQRVAALMKRLERPPAWERFLRERSELANAALFRVWSARLVEEQIRYFREIFHPEREVWQRHSRDLDRVAELGRTLEIDVRVVIWPHLGFPLDSRYPFHGIHARLDRRLAEIGLPHLDLLKTFEGVLHERLEAVPQLDPHPNEIAHRMAADAILEWLRETTPAIAQAVASDRFVVNHPVPSVRMRLEPFGFH